MLLHQYSTALWTPNRTSRKTWKITESDSQNESNVITMTSAAKHGIKLLHDPLRNSSTAFIDAAKQLGLDEVVFDVTETEELPSRRERKVTRSASLKKSHTGVTTK